MEIKEVIVSQFAEDDLNEYVEIIVSEFETNVMSLQQYPKRGRIAFELE